VKAAPLHVGDFVYCRSKYYRDQLQLPEEVGLVIEIKRSNFKILYPNDKRCWLPREVIAFIQPENLAYAAFLEKLHYLIKKVHAQECELISTEDSHRLSLRIDRIDHDTVDDLRHFLGPDFISLNVVPEGMAFMQLEPVNSGTVVKLPNWLRQLDNLGNRPNYSQTPML
jgi:hypothetical protein